MLDTHTQMSVTRTLGLGFAPGPLGRSYSRSLHNIAASACKEHARRPHGRMVHSMTSLESASGWAVNIHSPPFTCSAVCRSTANEAITTTTASSSTSTGSASDAPGGDAIYSLPQLYELAFSYRDMKQEIKFMRNAYKLHTDGSQPLTSVLDLGCGPGAHLFGLASAGVAHVTGMDTNTAMLDYARSKAQELAAASTTSTSSSVSTGFSPKQPKTKAMPGEVSFVQGDMRSIQAALAAAGHQNGPVDMVTCLLGTFSHMLTNRDALAVFRGVQGVLRPGGLFMLELAHPGDLFDGTLIIGDGGKEMWEVPIPGSKGKEDKLLVEWGAEFDNFDPVTQVIDRTVCMNRFQGEEVVQSVEEVVPARQFTVQEIEMLADASGLQVLQLYGDMSTSIGLTHEDAYRMVVVLKKL